MVKVPIGKKIQIDFWNDNKKQGLAKYFTDTLNLIRCESEFNLKEGDLALVIKSFDGNVVVLPDDEYSRLIKGSNLNKLDLDGLHTIIGKILKKSEPESGGILSFHEIISALKNTSIKHLIKKNHLKKTAGLKNPAFDLVEERRVFYLAIKPSENSNDIQQILNFSKNKQFITEDMIQGKFGWSDLRIKRIMEHLLNTSRCRKSTSYRKGIRYYFIDNSS
jgi:hypothetical protein